MLKSTGSISWVTSAADAVKMCMYKNNFKKKNILPICSNTYKEVHCCWIPVKDLVKSAESPPPASGAHCQFDASLKNITGNNIVFKPFAKET